MTLGQRTPTTARARLAAAASVLGVGGAVLIAVALAGQQHAPLPPASAAGSTGPLPASARPERPPPAAIPELRAGPPPLPASPPAFITIPAIGVHSPLIRLGQVRDGSVQVPTSYRIAGWYTGSVTPGESGAAVILGHVDSTTGPGTFYRLGELRPGDRVLIRRADQRTVAFLVTGVRTYRKDSFPTNGVYADTAIPTIRLVTCGGTFDPATHHYQSNVIAYGQMIPTAPKAATPGRAHGR